MKSYEELLCDFENAVALAEHLMRCNGELLGLLYKEQSGGFNRMQYKPFEETLH